MKQLGGTLNENWSMLNAISSDRNEYFDALDKGLLSTSQPQVVIPFVIPDALWEVLEPLIPDLETVAGLDLLGVTKRLIAEAILTMVYLQKTASFYRGSKCISPAVVSQNIKLWKRKRVFRKIMNLQIPHNLSTGMDWTWLNHIDHFRAV